MEGPPILFVVSIAIMDHDEEVDSTFIVLTEAEEAMLKEHVEASDDDEDDSFFTLEELITEFNDTKVENKSITDRGVLSFLFYDFRMHY